ncbi:hypothetical protein BDZ89DRAFT_1055750 [Hymenopellis radicata]|nr:hypothetical protein BDZ89DRAFT_1055750 [Hymenopellis radicata]
MDHQQGSEVVAALISSLPRLGRHQVPIQDSCPICLLPFSDFFDEDSGPDSGVTQLDGCGHVFCRKDLTEWIRTMHGSCPACRYVFLSIRPPSSDDESSDGGEYIPEDDEDDFFMGTDEMEIDDFEDVDDSFGAVGDLDPIDLDGYRNWEWQDQEDMEWGLTDGESESSPSEGDMSWNDGDNAVTADDVDIVGSDNEGAESIPSDLGRATEEDETK